MILKNPIYFDNLAIEQTQQLSVRDVYAPPKSVYAVAVDSENRPFHFELKPDGDAWKGESPQQGTVIGLLVDGLFVPGKLL